MTDIAHKKYRIDLAMGFFFLLCFITGLLRWPTRGVGGGIGFLISTIHLLTAIILTVLVLFHLSLNWDWLVCMTKKKGTDEE